MKKNKFFFVMVGLLGLPSAIITWLIFDLILERDLLEGLIYSISFGLVFSITWMVAATIRNRKKSVNIFNAGTKVIDFFHKKRNYSTCSTYRDNSSKNSSGVIP